MYSGGELGKNDLKYCNSSVCIVTFNYYCDEQWQCIVNGDQVLIIFNWSKPSVKQVSWILDIYN